jgi:hypothetical protein
VPMLAKSSMILIFQVLNDHKFGQNNRIVVEWGTTTKMLTPQPVDVGLYGLDSVLPRSGSGAPGSNGA